MPVNVEQASASKQAQQFARPQKESTAQLCLKEGKMGGDREDEKERKGKMGASTKQKVQSAKFNVVRRATLHFQTYLLYFELRTFHLLRSP